MSDALPPHASHILACAQTLRGGGVERALLRLAQGWCKAGRRVTLVIGDATGPLHAELPDGVETIVLGSARYRALLTLPAIVVRLRPDILFCPGSHYTSIAAWTRLRMGAHCPPVVAKLSNAPVRPDQRGVIAAGHAVWLRLHARFIDHLVAMTPATRDAALAATRMPRARTSVIANPPATVLGQPLPVPIDRRTILGVGRLVPQKRWDRLIAALPRVSDDQARLVILGEGSERAALEAQAQRLGIANRVTLAGHAPDAVGAMARAALIALTSEYEGVPGVLREALSVGTPVVATDSSASIAEIIHDPALGTIVARDDAAGLIAALDRWLAHDAVRPDPVTPPGADAATRYLALFDDLAMARRVQAGANISGCASRNADSPDAAAPAASNRG